MLPIGIEPRAFALFARCKWRARAVAYATLGIAGCLALSGCLTYPPARGYPREQYDAQRLSPDPSLVTPLREALVEHTDQSGFRWVSTGVDGLLLRLELIENARSSLDLQYYIYRWDESGVLVASALLRAAQRGVRVRILVDDGDTVKGDEQLLSLAGRSNLAIRVFNPWRYRGHSRFIRGAEFLWSGHRLDYRMHNKLFIADGVIALVGGRNIGDEYFQIDPDWQFADDDVVSVGTVVAGLADTFDSYWNSELAVPAQALTHRSANAATNVTTPPSIGHKLLGADFAERLGSEQPLTDVLSGRLALAWAPVEIACDSPDKRHAAQNGVGNWTYVAVASAIEHVESELTVVSPYLVPSKGEFELLEQSLRRHRRVQILTNSLESAPVLSAQARYSHYRMPLLKLGATLFELRAHPDTARGSGQPAHLSQYGHYSLHTKLLVFDTSGLFVGSMNYDERSRRLNTEVGLIIHSSALAEQAVRRFAAMTQPRSAYAVILQQARPDSEPTLAWRTEVAGRLVTYESEPARSEAQRIEEHFMALLPLDSEL